MSPIREVVTFLPFECLEEIRELPVKVLGKNPGTALRDGDVETVERLQILVRESAPQGEYPDPGNQDFFRLQSMGWRFRYPFEPDDLFFLK